MATTVDIEQLLKLSAEKRLQLISILWNSLDADDNAVDIDEDAWKEVDRRAEELKANPEMGMSLEDFRRKKGLKS